MKVLHISTEDDRPGASRAAYRLSQGLNQIGITSNILVQNKRSRDRSVYPVIPGGLGRIVGESRKLLDKTFLTKYPNRRDSAFSPQKISNINLLRQVNKFDPDLINLHWVCDGFLQIETIPQLKKPLVWTLRDMWPFTGGCHYDQDCGNYTNQCGKCPQLASSKLNDLSYQILKRKVKAWQNLDLNIIALSTWIKECAASSTLFQEKNIRVIPNGIDTDIFRPINKESAREILQLPTDKYLVLFGSVQADSDKRKGSHLLQGALHSLAESDWKEKIELVTFGTSESRVTDCFGFKSHNLGHLNDNLSLILAYSAANIFVAPSMQENLPNTVLESLACGTPSVAFKIGGMPDLIDHQVDGFLVNPFEISELAQGIVWTLESVERYQKLVRSAREKVEKNFTLNIQANRYRQFYSEILSARVEN